MKENEFNSKDLECIPKMITVLKYLNQGRELKFDKVSFKIAETEKGGMAFVSKVGEDEWVVPFGNPLVYFSEVCNSLTHEEITAMQANITLQEINSKKRR